MPKRQEDDRFPLLIVMEDGYIQEVYSDTNLRIGVLDVTDGEPIFEERENPMRAKYLPSKHTRGLRSNNKNFFNSLESGYQRDDALEGALSMARDLIEMLAKVADTDNLDHPEEFKRDLKAVNDRLVTYTDIEPIDFKGPKRRRPVLSI